jgi:ABC-2 type transport system ATP-binding protein
MLQVREVRKSYDEREVVRGVSFEVQAGEIFALLGPNGAGKTTLIRMITDITRPDSGQILFEGTSVTSKDRPRISYLPEERGLYRKQPVLDMLIYFGQLKDLTTAEARRQGVALLEEFGLAAWSRKKIEALSKGMQQKVQLCAALIGDPKLLILDEPFTGLDPVNVALLEDTLHKRRERGATVLLSTHQINKVEQLCDRCLMVNRGFSVLYGTVKDIRAQHGQHAAYVTGRDLPAAAPGVEAIARATDDFGVERTTDEWRVTLQRGSRPAEVLRALVQAGAQIESFQMAHPPLEQIFVEVANSGTGLDRGQSGGLSVEELDDDERALGGAVGGAR